MSTTVSEVYPLLWSGDVEAILEWSVAALGLRESWRATGDDGRIEHAEVQWPGGRVSINERADAYKAMGPSGISLRVDDQDEVNRVFALSQRAGAQVLGDPQDSPVAYSFTAIDPDGNQWWVNAESGMLDELRDAS